MSCPAMSGISPLAANPAPHNFSARRRHVGLRHDAPLASMGHTILAVARSKSREEGAHTPRTEAEKPPSHLRWISQRVQAHIAHQIQTLAPQHSLTLTLMPRRRCLIPSVVQ